MNTTINIEPQMVQNGSYGIWDNDVSSGDPITVYHVIRADQGVGTFGTKQEANRIKSAIQKAISNGTDVLPWATRCSQPAVTFLQAWERNQAYLQAIGLETK